MTVTGFLGQTRRQLTVQWSQPVYRAGYLLAASSVVTAVVGAAFWLFAARLYPPSVIGVNSGAISAMTFLAGVAQLNLMSAVLRFVPRAGARAGRMILGSLVVAGGLGALSAMVFRAGLGVWAPALLGFLGPWPVALSFVLASAGWGILVLETSALVAVGHVVAATMANQVFNLAKLALVVVLVALLPVAGVWFAWTLATGVAVVCATWVLFRRALPAFHAAPSVVPADVPSASDLARFVGPDYLASLAWIAATTLVPILVLDLTDPEHAAVFALAWAVCFVLYGVPAAFGQSLVTHGVREPSRLSERHRGVVVYSLSLVAPVVLVLVVLAPVLLRPFGSWYAEEGANTLRLLALSALPNTVVALTVSRARVTRQMGTVVGAMLGLAVAVLGLAWLLVPRIGISGAGVAWLAGQTAVAGGILVRRASQIRLRSRHSAVPTAVRRRVLDHLAAAGWTLERTMRTVSDTAVCMVSSADAPAVLKVAATEPGVVALAREQHVLGTLWSDDRLGAWRTWLPAVIGHGQVHHGSYLLLSRLPGTAAGNVRGADPTAVTAAVIEAMAPLHTLGSTRVSVEDAQLQGWVDEPLTRLARALPDRAAFRAALTALRSVLHQELAGRVLTLAWTHGDLHAGNVLLDHSGDVAGLLDWGGARDADPPVLDVVHWLLTQPTPGGTRQIGTRVAARLAATHCFSRAESSLLASVPGGLELSPRVAVLLAWLRHADSNLAKSERYAANPVWLRRNVMPVLRQVGHD